MKLFLIVFLSLGVIAANSQNPATSQPRGNGKISGTVIDPETKEPVEFATVALNNPATDKPIDGAIADAKGKFSITKIAPGNYKVVISFIGYETKTIDVAITDRKAEIDLGSIDISSSAKLLGEVVVEGEKAIMEEKVDRTVYNAENDNTTRGGDGTDVLRRVPMLSVDLDGNVSMRGNSNVRVLINNKPSTITASSVADALKQIPADQIKSVEVITSPSAKYDAEGSAGIINIITKKNTMQGATLGVDAGAGLRGSNLGLNGGYRKGKLGLSLGGHGRAGYNIIGRFENSQLSMRDDTVILNTQMADTRRSDLFGRYNLGLDYDINKFNVITASARFGVRNANNFQDDLFTRNFEDAVLNTSSLRNVEVVDHSVNMDFNLDYTHTYSKPLKEFSVMSQYSRNNRTNDFENIIHDETTQAILNRILNENKSFNQEITLQADYQTPIGTTQLVEMGAKNIERNVSSDYQSFTATGTNPYVASTDGSETNVFNYNQNVTAGYLSYTFNSKKAYSFKAGARYEYTTINADFENTSEITTDIPAYGVVVPSFNISRKFGSGKTLKAAYNRRIQRPSIQFLNPNIQASNPLNVTVGNPNLNPEYTDNYELSYSTFVKGTSLNFSGFVRNTTGAIQSVRELKGDTIFTNYQNIGRENAYGLSVFGNVNMGKLSLNGGGDFYYAVLTNNVADPIYNASNEGFVYSGRMFGSYKLSDTWGFQFFGFYRGRDVRLQGYQGGFGVYSLSLRKDFKNKKGSIGFGAENFFATSIKVRTETISPQVTQNSVNVMKNLGFRVNLSYRIGKMSFDAQPKRRKSVNNDDLKGDGDNQNNQNEQPQIQQRNGNQTQGRTGFTPGSNQQGKPVTEPKPDEKAGKKKKKAKSN